MSDTTALSTLTTPTNIDEIGRTAKMLALSGFFDSHQNQAVAMAQIGTKILAGAEYGFGPFASVQGIHIIQGKPVMSANLMAAALDRNPRYDYTAKFTTDGKGNVTGCTIAIERNGKHVGESEFTLADAKQAGLTGQQWQKFPRNMLFARAMSNAVRWYAPGVFNGSAVYVEGDLENNGDEPGYVDGGYTMVTEPEPNPEPTVDLDNIQPDGASAADNPFEDAPDPKTLLRKLHQVGTGIWPDTAVWTRYRHDLAAAVSENRTKSSKQLNAAELNHAIAVLNVVTQAKRIFGPGFLRAANEWVASKDGLPDAVVDLSQHDAERVLATFKGQTSFDDVEVAA